VSHHVAEIFWKVNSPSCIQLFLQNLHEIFNACIKELEKKIFQQWSKMHNWCPVGEVENRKASNFEICKKRIYLLSWKMQVT
jgi:hypothetical protein